MSRYTKYYKVMTSQKPATKEAIFMDCLDAWQSYQGSQQQTLDLLKGNPKGQIEWFLIAYKRIVFEHIVMPKDITIASFKTSLTVQSKKIIKGTEYGYDTPEKMSPLNKFLRVMTILKICNAGVNFR